MKNRMGVLGECMIEVSASSLLNSDVTAGISYGGDTFNVAAYYARLGGSVDYLSALGDDPLSTWMLDRWIEEGVDCGKVVREPGGVPGLYLIQVDDTGERSFIYWRDNSPARHLLSSATALKKLLDKTEEYSLFYLSGISLSMMTEAAREVFFEFASNFRSRGGLIAFDGNYRSVQWPDKKQAQAIYERVYRHVDIALSTAEDECALFANDDAKEVAERLWSWGVKEIAIKDGNADCILFTEGAATGIPAEQAKVVDTTAAGDSFNAAYLASRAKGMDCLTSVQNGHLLAATVVGHRGAIIPVSVMPDFERHFGSA